MEFMENQVIWMSIYVFLRLLVFSKIYEEMVIIDIHVTKFLDKESKGGDDGKLSCYGNQGYKDDRCDHSFH